MTDYLESAKQHPQITGQTTTGYRPGIGENVARVAVAATLAAGAAGIAEATRPGTLSQGAEAIGITSSPPTPDNKNLIPEIKRPIYGEYTGVVRINLEKARLRSDAIISESVGEPTNFVRPKKLGEIDIEGINELDIHSPLIVIGQDVSGDGSNKWIAIPTKGGFVFASFSDETSGWLVPDGFGNLYPFTKGPNGEFLQPTTGHSLVALPKSQETSTPATPQPNSPSRK